MPPCPYWKQESPVGICPSTSLFWYRICDPVALATKNWRPRSPRALRCVQDYLTPSSAPLTKPPSPHLIQCSLCRQRWWYHNSAFPAQSGSHVEAFRGCSEGCVCVYGFSMPVLQLWRKICFNDAPLGTDAQEPGTGQGASWRTLPPGSRQAVGSSSSALK